MKAAGKLPLFFAFCFMLALPCFANAATYYVDATGGSDLNSGTSTSAPWKTVTKVNGKAFAAGDTILFKRGEVWHEQLIVSSAGTSGNPITFGAYGTGAKPAITAADNVAGWNLYSGSIYVAYVGSITPPDQLFVDDTFYEVAHYPNSGYRLATANSANSTTIIDTNLALSASQVVGATAMSRTVPWSVSSGKVTAYDATSHTLTLGTAVDYNAMRKGFGYYLKNMFWMLDAPGEWFYDAATGNLYLWMPASDSPTGHTVSLTKRSYGIINKKSYVTIQDLAVGQAGVNDVYVYGADHVILNNLDVNGGNEGIYIGTSTNTTVSNCAVKSPLSDGIIATGSGYVTITGNSVDHAGYVGMPRESSGGIIITKSSTNSTAANNVVTNSGNNGIHLGGDLNAIKDNVVDHSCMVLSDCAGIYTYGMDATISTRKTISGNTVSNTMGNISGTTSGGTEAEGIYLDDGTHDTKVLNNVVTNSDLGIYIHTGHNNTVTGNTVYSTRTNGLLIEEAGAAATAPGVVYNNVVKGNSFETVTSGATASYYSSIESSTLGFGSYDNNRYCHPSTTSVVQNQGKSYDLPTWQQVSGQDLNSTQVQAQCTAPAPTLNLTAAPPSNGSALLTWSSTDATSCTASGAWSGMKPVSSSQAVTASGTYTLTCTGRGGSTTDYVSVAVDPASTTTPPPPVPTVTIAASPSSVAYSGSSTLTWSSTDATSCSASGAWSGTKATSGSTALSNLTASGTYTLTCTGAGGTASQSATITVAPATVPAAPTLTFTANPTTVSRRGSSTLSWSAANATSCLASGGWSGTKAVSGSQSLRRLYSTKTYNLSCTGGGGTVSKSVTVTVL